MRKLSVVLLLFAIQHSTNGQDLSYYLPDSIEYNPSIPKPTEVIYHQVGQWHVTHDRLVNYMKALAAAAPDRIKLETMGFTYEGRPQVLLIITSPKNHSRLEEIRQQHLMLDDPSRSASVNIENMPIVLYIGHSIHGNESSGANASLLSAYYLAAAKGKQIDEILENEVILFDPSFNPDGLQRFSTWANQHKSKNLVSDPNDREFNEVWPTGRFNHYWFDLNRDWLPAVHIESQNRLKWFHMWKPNILTDHHEQGSNATFFFQPGVPSRVNPLTPEKNQQLTAKLAKFHAAFLDRIGSLYFTKENYDDFYYGKGSTYPDINGAIGILFEQASSRGHLQQTANGLLSFPFTIRNQFTTTLSTIEGAKVLRKEFLAYQRDFYKNGVNEANAAATKAYVFGDKMDKAKTFHFIEMLRRHHINLYELSKDLKVDNSANSSDVSQRPILFEKGTSYIVPTNQMQYKVIRTIFEKTFEYKDSLFYDITAWTMPLAFGIPCSELNVSQFNSNLLGEKVEQAAFPKGELVGGKSKVGYLMDWSELYAPAVVNELLNENVVVKVSTNRFEMDISGAVRGFDYGTILIPIQLQEEGGDKVYELLNKLAQKYGVNIYGMRSGNAISGSDPGSSKFAALTKPVIAMVTGTGVNPTDAGEVWHLLDQRFNVTCSHVDPAVFNRIDLAKYNTIILVGGTYNDLNKDKLKTWIQGGGTLILTEEAVSWASQNGISTVTLKKTRSPVDSSVSMNYVIKEQIDGAQQIYGAIFGAEVDGSHPLGYGYHQKTVSLFKANKVFMEKSKNPYANPFFYGAKPLQSGWVSKENYEAIRNSAAVVVNTIGNGRIINIADDPNFRAFWLGGSKLFMNAIFFSRVIELSSGRTD